MGAPALGHIEGNLWNLAVHRNSAQKNHQYQVYKDVDLVVLLEATRNRRCKEPRDRIYGLLGLIRNWRFTEPITPDCELNIEELYITATWKATIETQTTVPLAYNQPKKNSTLPSWVPDWSRTLTIAEKVSIPLTMSSKSYPGRQEFELLSNNRLPLNMVYVGNVEKTLGLSDFGIEKANDTPMTGDAVIEAIQTC